MMVLRQDKYADMAQFRKTRNAQRHRYYAKTSGYSRRQWTQEEMTLVMDRSLSDSELSEKIGRGVRAIQIKRNRMKKAALGVQSQSDQTKTVK
ncbi:hypothetical protein KCG48_05080 [Proteiniclasticum sp. BAD-10]|uniref:Uncharacterized protein n=1 Tax=Proteiniclasticum sediminis TaxID=2804028 RepID=A0A941HPU1_9CLOT|nr:hypothetical protein [Proteiniclasticum sediminis]MBR0575714.1 hypothetical protein [Proteiniclasticum sediminis]